MIRRPTRHSTILTAARLARKTETKSLRRTSVPANRLLLPDIRTHLSGGLPAVDIRPKPNHLADPLLLEPPCGGIRRHETARGDLHEHR